MYVGLPPWFNSSGLQPLNRVVNTEVVDHSLYLPQWMEHPRSCFIVSWWCRQMRQMGSLMVCTRSSDQVLSYHSFSSSGLSPITLCSLCFLCWHASHRGQPWDNVIPPKYKYETRTSPYSSRDWKNLCLNSRGKLVLESYVISSESFRNLLESFWNHWNISRFFGTTGIPSKSLKSLESYWNLWYPNRISDFC